MKPRILFLTTVLTVTTVIAPIISAKEKKSSTPSPGAAASPETALAVKKTRAFPYHGRVASVDVAARTFMVGKRTFTVTNDTTITKDGATAAITDIMTDEMVGGSYWKKEDGTLEARTVKVGRKSTAPASSASARSKKDETKK